MQGLRGVADELVSSGMNKGNRAGFETDVRHPIDPNP
jgi:hypothetical protein